jgi:hypothetical protein
MSVEEWGRLWKLQRETRTSLNLGNITPGSARFVCEVTAPPTDAEDQRYEFGIWARNGFFSEQLLMHRTGGSDWVWAWRIEKSSPEVNNGKPQEIDRQVVSGFPQDKLKW